MAIRTILIGDKTVIVGRKRKGYVEFMDSFRIGTQNQEEENMLYLYLVIVNIGHRKWDNHKFIHYDW